jgi:putative transposase
MSWGNKKDFLTANKYPKRKLNRLSDFNYAETGGYFITLCVDGGSHKLGYVIDGVVQLSDMGQIAYDQFAELQEHYQKVSIDCFVVMPNHVHAIVVINGIFNPGISLPKIIQAYKSMTIRKINKNSINFKWQRSYWDSIIKTVYGLERIREYINNNPAQWDKDAENAALKIDKKEYYRAITESMKEENP